MPRRWRSWICRPGRARSSCAAAVTPTTCRAAISSTRRPARCGRCAFDLARLETRGTPVPVVPDVVTTANGGVDAVVAGDGTLAYVSGGVAAVRSARSCGWTARAARRRSRRRRARMSIRGCHPMARASRWSHIDQEQDLWVWDLGRTTLTRAHVRPWHSITYPVWTPDGRRLIFSSERAGAPESLLAGGGRHRRGRAADRESQPAECNGRVARRPPADLHRDGPEDGRGRDAAGSWTGPIASTPLVQSPFTERNGDRLARRPLARLRGE